MGSVHGEGLEVKNEQRKHEYRGKNHPRVDTVCHRGGTHTQRNDRNIMCACMCGKGDVAVTQTTRTNECRKNACGTQFRFIKQGAT
jgi:hypothetical protein